MKTSSGRDTRAAQLIPGCTAGHEQLQQRAGASRAAPSHISPSGTMLRHAEPSAGPVHKSPSVCSHREVSCTKKSPWDVHPKTGHTPWSCTPPLQLGDGDHSVLWCWLSLMASSPHALKAITHLTEEELSFFPVPLQKPLSITACLQPETGAARASLPAWAEALPTDKAQPPSPLQGAGSACSKPVLQVCRWGF